MESKEVGELIDQANRTISFLNGFVNKRITENKNLNIKTDAIKQSFLEMAIWSEDEINNKNTTDLITSLFTGKAARLSELTSLIYHTIESCASVMRHINQNNNTAAIAALASANYHMGRCVGNWEMFMKFDSIKHGVEKREDQIDKMEFQKWAQDENIIIDRITDLWDIQSINPEWLAYSKVILKNWYKEAQPNVKLKSGRPK